MIRPATNQLRAAILREAESFFTLLLLLFLSRWFAVIYIARHPLLRLAGSFWVVDDAPENSDVIVMLGDDNYHGRPRLARRGAVQVRDGSAHHRQRPVSAALRQHRRTRAARPHRSRRARRRHCAAGAPCRGYSRGGEAIGQLLSSHGWKRVILVTSDYHTRRSRYICERIFPAGTVLRVAAARDSEYDPEHWWESRRRSQDLPPRVRRHARGHVGAAA